MTRSSKGSLGKGVKVGPAMTVLIYVVWGDEWGATVMSDVEETVVYAGYSFAIL
jgi:hypothetical protein